MQKIIAVNDASSHTAAVVGRQVTALASSGIRSTVRPSTRVDGGVTVRVTDSDKVAAKRVLKAAGLIS
jgi:hypothetical protein